MCWKIANRLKKLFKFEKQYKNSSGTDVARTAVLNFNVSTDVQMG